MSSEQEPIYIELPRGTKLETMHGEILASEYMIYAFKRGSFKDRIYQLAELLRICIGNSNMGEKLDIKDDRLVIEIKRLLFAVCYLFNSTSFREGEYQVYDLMEVDRKLGRKREMIKEVSEVND